MKVQLDCSEAPRLERSREKVRFGPTWQGQTEESRGEAAGEGAAQMPCRPEHFGVTSTYGAASKDSSRCRVKLAWAMVTVASLLEPQGLALSFTEGIWFSLGWSGAEPWGFPPRRRKPVTYLFLILQEPMLRLWSF